MRREIYQSTMNARERSKYLFWHIQSSRNEGKEDMKVLSRMEMEETGSGGEVNVKAGDSDKKVDMMVR